MANTNIHSIRTNDVSAPDHPLEGQRLAILRSLGILDTPPEERFDLLTELVCEVVNCPISTITLVDEHRQWHKSAQGIPLGESPREAAFCAHTILEDEILVINNTLEDDRFKFNTFVLEEPNIRAYAGVPLRTCNSLPVGTLCAIDVSPREWTDSDKRLLSILARLIEKQINAEKNFEVLRSKALLEANIDPVLNCLDLTGFVRLVSGDIKNRKDKNYPPSIISFKINNLDSINFKYGFSFKNKVLIESVIRFQKIIKEKNAVAGRLSRNIIASYHFDISDTELNIIAERCWNELSKQFFIDDKKCRLDISIAVFENIDQFDDIESILQANLHLHSKIQGVPLNIVSFNKDVEAKEVRHRVSVRSKVRNALYNDEFTMHYQPKVSIDSLRVTGLEALLRWTDPDMGYIPPPIIIDTIKELELSDELSTWIIRHVIKDIMQWKQAGAEVFPVSINLSEDQLKLPDFPYFISNELSDSGLDSGLIEFEILESSLIDDMDMTRKNMAELSDTGIRFSIDDFGTGYSALKLLNNLPLSAIKIDRSFIRYIAEKKEDSALAHSIITIGHDAGLKVIAEGVETYEQFLLLRALNCDQIQGYYFSKPVTSEETLKLLIEGGKFEHTSN